MSDAATVRELINSVRTSDAAKGRTYSGASVDPTWLAKEIAEFCKTRGWENKITAVPDGNGWLVVTNHIAALVEGNDEGLVVKVLDGNPVGLKAALVCNGLLALTGAGIIALPLTGWRHGDHAVGKRRLNPSFNSWISGYRLGLQEPQARQYRSVSLTVCGIWLSCGIKA